MALLILEIFICSIILSIAIPLFFVGLYGLIAVGLVIIFGEDNKE